METSFLTRWISEREINAICWTLIHSLWIGLVIALLSGVMITITRKSAAALRYNLLCGMLLLFTLSVCITFYLEMRTSAIDGGNIYARQVIHAPDNHIIIVPATASHISLANRTVMLLNAYSNAIFIVWLLFFMLKSLKMVSGLLYIQRIRNYKTQIVSEELKHKIELFSNQIGIRRAVRLVQSELVKVPVAVGWLKPMILLPVGITFQLTPEQLDSILWHELAHIRRSDYLVNILQGVVETAFFFNPGLLWLSSLIRAEREACCDDIVLSHTSHKANYLEALLSFGYGEFKNTGFAMGIGSGNQLRDRLKRIIERENKRLNMAEKTALAAGLIALSAFTGLTKTTGHVHVQTANKPTERVARTFDSSNDKMDSLAQIISASYKKGDDDSTLIADMIAENNHGKEYHFTLADNKLLTMDINGEKVKDEDLPKYQYMINRFEKRQKAYGTISTDKLKTGEPDPSIDKTDTTVHLFDRKYEWSHSAPGITYYLFAESDAGTKYCFTITKSKLVALTVSGAEIQNRDLRKYVHLLKHIPPPPPPAPLQPASTTPRQGASGGKTDTLKLVHISTYSNRRGGGDTTLISDVKAKDNNGKNYHFIIAGEKLTSMSIDGKKIKESDLPKYEYIAETWRVGQKASQRFVQEQLNKSRRPQDPRLIQEQLNNSRQPQEPTQPPSLDKMIADVTNDLIDEHIIKDKSGLSTIKLTNSELIVNGVKQPDEIRKKFAAKYYPGDSKVSKNPNYGLWYNARTHGVALGDFNIDLDAL